MTRAEELQAMLVKARRYLSSANILQQQGDYDSAISRLYYAMFYAAEALLFSKGLTFSSHRGVLSAFAQHFIKPKILPPEMHQWLRDGFEKRQISDYEFLITAGESEVNDLKSKAERFLARAEVLLQQSGFKDEKPTS